MIRVLICGLPGSGKTTMAKSLRSPLQAAWFNADAVRLQFDDWRFDDDGRLRQTHRMKNLCDLAADEGKHIAICDYVAPTPALRQILDPHVTIFMNTIAKSRYTNTNDIFVSPSKPDVIVNNFEHIKTHKEFYLFSLQDKLHNLKVRHQI